MKRKKSRPAVASDVFFEKTGHRYPSYVALADDGKAVPVGTVTVAQGRGYFKVAASRPFLTAVALNRIRRMVLKAERDAKVQQYDRTHVTAR